MPVIIKFLRSTYCPDGALIAALREPHAFEYQYPRDLFNLFVGNIEKLLLFGLFLPGKIITILRKITLNFGQMSLRGVLSVSVPECFSKIF